MSIEKKKEEKKKDYFDKVDGSSATHWFWLNIKYRGRD